MKNKTKLIGKIITTVFATLLIVCLFTPLLTFSSGTYISSTGTSDESVLAEYVTPMQVIAAHFASEEDLEDAKNKYDALTAEIALSDASTEAKADQLAASEEAARYYTILFSQQKELLGLSGLDEDINMIGAMKLYTYFIFGFLAISISLIVLLILRCIFPKNKGISISSNILSILTFLLSVASLFITIPMVLERSFTITNVNFNINITPNPNLLFCGIFIGIALLAMILTLTTKGLKKNKKETQSA